MNIINKLSFLLERSQKKGLILIFVLMLIGMVFESLSISLVLPLLVAISDPELFNKYPVALEVFSTLDINTYEQVVIFSIVILVSSYFFKSVFLIYSGWIQSKFTARLKVEFAQKLFSIYMHQSYEFHLQKNSSKLIQIVSGEVNELVSTFSSSMLILSECLVVIGISYLLIIVEPLGFISVMIIIFLFGYVFYTLMKNKVHELGVQRRKHNTKVLQYLQQGFLGVKDIKILGRESFFIEKHRVQTEHSSKVNIIFGLISGLPRHIFEFMTILLFTIFVYIIIIVNKNDSNLILPTIGIFSIAAFRLMPSANKILTNLQRIKHNTSIIDKVCNDILNSQPKILSTNLIKGVKNKIEISGVDYIYPPTTDLAIHNLNVSIVKGSCIGFIGASGAGKSTLIDIILGLLKPDKGKVLVDGIDIQDDLRGWQDNIGYVPQSIYLTDDTLKNNIAFGISEKDIDDKAIADAIHQSQLKDFIKNLPEGVNTMVGEDGVRLSGGQRQRIGIARALYHNPSVLVLDEATSALDTTTESDVMETINSLHVEKTIIIIAHRMSTLKKCDCIYKLRNGAIVDQGVFSKIADTN